MSHNFPHRRLPAQTDTPPPGYGPRRAGGGGSGPPSFSEPPYTAPGSDLAVGLLQSYGLGASDLARLAQLPEEMLNLDSLPHLLRKLKESRETTSAGLPPSAAAAFPPSSCHPAESRPPCAPLPLAVQDQWAQIRNQPVQYPLEHILSATKSNSLEQLPSSWSHHQASPRSEKPLPTPPSSSSPYLLDFGLQERTADQGEQGRDDRGGRPARGQQSSGQTPPPPRSSWSDSASHYGPGLTRLAHRAWPRKDCQPDSLPHSRPGAVQPRAAPTAPSRKEALDFHGSPPGAFPYSCSLCDVTALSAKVWQQHINGSHHADQQLALLQRYPSWDCRMGRKSRFDQPAEWKDNERPAHRPLSTNHNSGPRRNKGMAKKTGGGNSKVVCAKFEANCVDEVGLRTLMEPFGKIVKVILFPCLAFVELGSSIQAKDLEKYYSSNPAAVQGKEVTFEISSTFNFLQSSRVLSFTPAPVGDEGFSDLLGVVRRFGAPLYVLALPSQAFIEMKLEAEAKKLVDYYSSNSLQLNGEVIKVGFSGEYNTLMRVSSAKKYEEQQEGGGEERGAGGGGSSSTKRSRSPHRQGGGARETTGSFPRGAGPVRGWRAPQAPCPVMERLEWTQPRLKSLLTNQSCAFMPARQPAVSDQPTTAPRPADHPDHLAESSEEESDIEGMAVIGEDGESLDEEEEEEEEDKEREREESSFEVDVKEKREEEQTSKAEHLEGEERQNIMEFLANCITLDELEGEEEEERRKEKKEEQVNEDKQEESESMKSSGSEAMQASREPENQPSSEGSVLDPTWMGPILSPGREVLSDRGADTSEEEPRRSSRHSSEKEVLEDTPSSPVDSIPLPTGTQETSQISPEDEEESSLSRKCLSEEQEVLCQAETSPREKDCLADELSEPGSQDQDEAAEDRMIPSQESNPPLREQNPEALETSQAAACRDGLVLPAQPTKPIGAEFVRPVVGYFCNLCKVIYVDEEEAKTTHCSTLTHYQKYQEHTGQDPWST